MSSVEPQKKVVKIYYKEQEQMINYYTGTQQHELEATIKGLFSISNTEFIFFLDENGQPIVLSPSSIPNESKLYMQVKQLEQSQQTSTISSSSYTQPISDFEQGPLYFKKKNENAQHPQIDSIRKTATKFDMDAPFDSLKIDKVIEAEKSYYFEITFPSLTCCMTMCLYDDKNRQGEQSNISSLLGASTTYYASNPLSNIVGGFYISTKKNKKCWKIVNLTTKQTKDYALNSSYQNMHFTLWTKHQEAEAYLSDLKQPPAWLTQ